MKWIFLLALLIMTPVLMNALKDRPQRLLWAGVVIGLSPFITYPLHLYVAPISWPAWTGTVKGLEVSFVDALAIAIIGATKAVPSPVRLKVAVAIIAASFFLSSIAAADATPSIFYIWQFARSCLMFVAILRASSASPEFPFRILAGYAAGMIYEAYLTLTQFLGGDIQAGGSFGHQNQLGMLTMFIVFPAFALLIAKRRTKTALVILLSEVVVVFAGGSRATIGLFGAGLVITLFLSIWHKGTGRKATAAAITAMLIAVSAPVMILAIERRPEAARASSVDERQRFEHAAQMIIADHPLGVGANRYVVTANLGGYSDRAGVPWNYSERSAPVHNAYYLITAEMGVIGLAGYVLLLGSILLIGLRGLRRTDWSERSELLVGLTATSIVTTIHFYFEYVPMLSHIHYLVAINAGMLVCIATSSRKQSASVPVPARRKAAPAAA
ncbi:O-antigen ligase family protein [Sphingomonas rhizophila]|uniref:O-antigen ligase family protein n=1 Tax=Sphingomonas rhizophila TaxID=2071607 RepID=A0A7G9SBT8_9SPHN|nr:O-antigen ligase family protein [Sphingomonas rhizophila]QNN65313.1 O-antigen ligase family protein [Sphingomonas rhizophila]